MKIILLKISGAILLTLTLYVVTLLPTGARDRGPLESIHGIPFPVVNGVSVVEEDMAHTDVYIDQPVFAKSLQITVTFIPHDTERLDVGLRENSFWLSYPKQTIYTRKQTTSYEVPTTASVTIPLTDKLQEPDQSVDMMFFITSDEPYLEVVAINTELLTARPTYTEFKDYARAILKRERAI